LVQLKTISPSRPSPSATLSARPLNDPAMLCQIAAAAANSIATTMMVFSPRTPSSSGTSARHPPAAPSRSKKYTLSTRSMPSEMASETIVPERKKGSAVEK